MKMLPREPRAARHRHLTDEERVLWSSITRSVAPLRPTSKQSDATAPEEAAAAPVAEPSAPPPRAPGIAAQKPPPKALPLAPLGRRMRQRVARGGMTLDARIDLHGLTQERAHRALIGFLRTAQTREAKLVLVITGKGARMGEHHPERERGVLKRMVPHWLALPEFRDLVVGFEPAHIGHGGEGALYVRVRRGK